MNANNGRNLTDSPQLTTVAVFSQQCHIDAASQAAKLQSEIERQRSAKMKKALNFVRPKAS